MIRRIGAKIRDNSQLQCLSIAFFVVTLQHLFIREYTGDAATAFSHYLDRTTLLATLHWRYTTWTSRIFIESVLLKLSQNMHIKVWIIIDILMWMLLLWSLMKLTRGRHNYLIMSLVLMIPLSLMNGAGWMATSINYFWPAALGTFALVSLYKIYYHEKVNKVTGLVTLLGLAFATNFETYGVMYLCILSFFAVAMILKRRVSTLGVLFTASQYLICIANVGLALIAPGNKARVLVETKFRMLDFANLGPFDKLVMGYTHTFSELTDKNFFFFLFTIMLVVIALFLKSKSRRILVAAFIPFSFVLARTIIAPIAKVYLPEFSALFKDAAEQQRIDALNYFNVMYYIPFLLYVVLLISILLVLCNAFKNFNFGIFLTVVFVSGLLTTVAVGFSPSMYVSGPRTFLFLDIILIYIITIMYEKSKPFISQNMYLNFIAKWGLIAFTVFSVINNFIAIGISYS